MRTLALLAAAVSALAQTGPLPSWIEGAPKQWTLWAEQPM